jgi:hypothetical protein
LWLSQARRRENRKDYRKDTPMLKITARYARYLLSTLSAVAFGLNWR